MITSKFFVDQGNTCEVVWPAVLLYNVQLKRECLRGDERGRNYRREKADNQRGRERERVCVCVCVLVCMCVCVFCVCV